MSINEHKDYSKPYWVAKYEDIMEDDYIEKK
jgi:hypothetical protein